MRPRDVQASRFTLEYGVTRVADGATVATGSTVLAAFDYGKRRVSRLPKAFQASLQALAGA